MPFSKKYFSLNLILLLNPSMESGDFGGYILKADPGSWIKYDLTPNLLFSSLSHVLPCSHMCQMPTSCCHLPTQPGTERMNTRKEREMLDLESLDPTIPEVENYPWIFQLHDTKRYPLTLVSLGFLSFSSESVWNFKGTKKQGFTWKGNIKQR